MTSKITRKTASIFSGSALAAPGGIAQFGSLAASAPAYSTDPAIIQSLSSWLDGWNTAIVAGDAPCLEDMNAVNFVNSYQTAYLLQQGIAEWDSGTTYFTNSFCQVSGVIYKSLVDNNLNNPPASSPVDWVSYFASYPSFSYISLGGTANAMTATIPNFPNTIPIGTTLSNFTLFLGNTINATGTCTLAINGGTPVNIKDFTGAALSSYIVVGGLFLLSLMELIGDFNRIKI